MIFMVYATTQQLADFMGLVRTVPDRDTVGSARERETLGTGDSGTTTVFWTDNAYVVGSSYTFQYGATESGSLNTLTETTHYTFNKALGKLTLTTSGGTTAGTASIFGSYNYLNVGITDAQLSDAIARAEEEIDKFTNNHFADGTSATPDWNQSLNEKQDGQGPFKRNYFSLQNYPLPDVSTNLSEASIAGTARLIVDSTDGFPSTGSLLIDSEKIPYSGKSTTAFTLSGTASTAHTDNTFVGPYVVEISTTTPGGTISWEVLEKDTEFDMDRNTGRVQIYADGVDYNGTYVDVDSSPLNRVANRFRFSYIHGSSTIPVDITKATLMLAAKDLMSLAVRKAHTAGLNDFNPSMFEIDKDELNRILMSYRHEQYSRS